MSKCAHYCVSVCVLVCVRVCVWKRGRRLQEGGLGGVKTMWRESKRERESESERDLFRQNFSVVIRACLEPTSNPVSLWQRPTTDEDLKKLPPPIFFLKKKSF